MTRIYTTTFAATGDKETLAATDPGTGKVSLPSGWTPDYEKLDTDPSYRPVGRKEMNGVINEVTAAVGELQQYGFAPWQALTGGWPLNARVVSGGIVYKSTAAANTAVPPAAPWVMDAAADINSAPAKPVLADADELGVTDSANSFGLVKVTWANIKATLKTYFDTLYAAAGANNDITSLSVLTSINGGPLAGFRNRLDNSNFAINQRTVSGTVVLTAGVYGHDRFKAGASGCTYTFATSANVTTLTITAGSLQQVVEGVNLQTGTHCLSWVGTAQGKIGAGSYSASGVTGAVTGGTNTTVEWGTGTLAKPQFEPGTVATAYESKSYSLELFACRRYLPAILSTNTLTVVGTGQAYSTTAARVNVKFSNDARVTPTGVFYQTGVNFSCTTASASGVAVGGAGLISITAASAQNAWIDITGLSGLVAGDSTTAYMNTSGASILFTGCEL